MIAADSPCLLSMRGATVYDMDSDPVRTSRRTDLPAVRAYYDFFKANESAFNRQHPYDED